MIEEEAGDVGNVKGTQPALLEFWKMEEGAHKPLKVVITPTADSNETDTSIP